MGSINEILAAEGSKLCSRYGAPMGASNIAGDLSTKLNLQRVKLNSDYAADGTYWGCCSKRLWCAYSEDTRIYVRAVTRTEALAVLLETYPTITLKRY